MKKQLGLILYTILSILITFIILHLSFSESYCQQVTKVMVANGGFDHDINVMNSFLLGYSSYDGTQFNGTTFVANNPNNLGIYNAFNYANTNNFQILLISTSGLYTGILYAPSYPSVKLFMPSGNNTYQAYSYTGDILQCPVIVTGAGDTENMTGYKVEFFGKDIITTSNLSSFSNGYIAGQLAFLSNYFNISLDSSRSLARKYSSNNGVFDQYDGYGKIDVGYIITEIQDEPTSFAIIGDFGDDDSDELAVANMVKGWNPDFIITTGDNSYDSTPIDNNIGKYYSDYIYPYSGSYGSGATINKFWVTLGNHDYSDGGGIDAHYNYFVLPNNERYYDKVIGNVHLFMINSCGQEPNGTSSTSIQANWIKARMIDCVTNHNHWRVAAFHHPPYSSGSHGSSTNMQWGFQALGMHFVVAGHDHDYERLEVNGFPYFVNGSGGRNLRSFSSSILSQSVVRYNAKYGAQLVEINGTVMTIKFYAVPGTLIDTRIITDPLLPVELTSFTGRVINDKIVLEWKTATEVNNYGFDIERNTNNTWQKIGFVNGYGNSNSPKSYSFEDELQYGNIIYRLKQIDNDGQYKYSDEVEIYGTNDNYVLQQNYPNPFNAMTRIKYYIRNGGIVKFDVFNILGENISTQLYNYLIGGNYYIDFNADKLTSGVYIYQLTINNDIIGTKKLVILK